MPLTAAVLVPGASMGWDCMELRRPGFEGGTEMMSAADDASGPALGASRVGAELRAARQRLGWALPDVARELRIRLPYLEAIEDGRVADLPGNAYAVGFLRTYATTLGLDASEVARRFRAEALEVNQKTKLIFPAPVPERGVPAGAVVLLGVVLAAGAYAAWYKVSEDRRADVGVAAIPERLAPLADRVAPPSNLSPQVASVLPPQMATPAPAAAPPPVVEAVVAPAPPPPPAPAAPVNRLILRVKSDAWIQVREKQGQVLLNRVLRAGETWPVPNGGNLLLTTGNAGGTELLVDGNATASLGAAGVVRKDIPLEIDALKPGTRRPLPAQQQPQ